MRPLPSWPDTAFGQWVDGRLGGYVKESIPQRQEAVKELVQRQGMSRNKAAQVLGVAEGTVRNDLIKSSQNCEPPAPFDAASQEQSSQNSEPLDAVAALAGDRATAQKAVAKATARAEREAAAERRVCLGPPPQCAT